MNRCPKCGQALAGIAVVCQGCGYVAPDADELQLQPAVSVPTATASLAENSLEEVPPPPVVRGAISFEDDNYFKDYVLPWILLALGLAPNIALSILAGGALGVATLAVDLSLLFVVQLPLIVLVMMLTGIVFGINFGWLSTGIVKLAALTMVIRGLLALGYLLIYSSLPEAGIVFLIVALPFQFWLFMYLFDLEMFEAIVCIVVMDFCLLGLQALLGVVLYLLQGPGVAG